MKKLLFAFLLFAAVSVNAQTITNATFEAWTSSGKEPPFDWEEPTNWKSTNSLTEWTSAGISKSTVKHNGLYSVKIRSVMVNEGWYSVLCNGNPKLVNSFTAPDINIITGGAPLNGTIPKALTGYYRFTQKTAGDSAYAIVLLKKYNPATGMYDTAAVGKKVLGPNSAFSLFEIPVKTINAAVQPDSFVIAFYSSRPYAPSKPTNFTDLGELYIDDIAFSQSVGLKQPSQNSSLFSLYPNPSSGEINISVANNENLKLRFVAMDGKQLYTNQIQSNTTVDVKHFPDGLYMVFAEDTKGNISVQKLIITK